MSETGAAERLILDYGRVGGMEVELVDVEWDVQPDGTKLITSAKLGAVRITPSTMLHRLPEPPE